MKHKHKDFPYITSGGPVANKKKIDQCAMGKSLRNKAQDIRVKLREEINNAKS